MRPDFVFNEEFALHQHGFRLNRLVPIALALCWSALPAPTPAQTWQVQSGVVDTNLRGLSVVRARSAGENRAPVIWASGSNGVVLRSVDSGRTWSRLPVPGGEALDFRGIQAFDERTAYLMSAGNGGASRYFKTTDGGQNWATQYTGNSPAIFLDALACLSEKQCFALGDPVDGKFLLLRTDDGSAWKVMPRDSMPAALQGEGAFAASGTCLAVTNTRDIFIGTGGSAARIFHSADLGQSWKVVETPVLSGDSSEGIFSVLPQGSNLYVVGGDYKNPRNDERIAAFSKDKGATWQLAGRQPAGYRSSIGSLDGLTLAAVGPTGTDVSSDGGMHWTHVDDRGFNVIAVLDSANAWAAGPNGVLARFSSHEAKLTTQPR